jgi:hypothetical protein
MSPLQADELSDYWRRGATLLHQQCWCWGQDIQRPQGNLLIQYGFERSRRPEHRSGSSRYTLRSASATVRLWGFGITYLRPDYGCIYVNRYCFVPRWIPGDVDLDDVWQDTELNGFRRPGTRRQVRRSRRLLQALMRWVSGYEIWVASTFGAPYRQATLASWTKTSIPPERMALEWELLARRVEEPPP